MKRNLITSKCTELSLISFKNFYRDFVLERLLNLNFNLPGKGAEFDYLQSRNGYISRKLHAL